VTGQGFDQFFTALEKGRAEYETYVVCWRIQGQLDFFTHDCVAVSDYKEELKRRIAEKEQKEQERQKQQLERVKRDIESAKTPVSFGTKCTGFSSWD